MSTRLRILKEAGILFGRYGIKSVTMDTIADHLGISKRTIYENFKDKDDLLLQSIEEGMKFHKEIFTEMVTNAPNVIMAIFSINKFNCEMQEKINPLFFEDMKKYHSNIHEKLNFNSDMDGAQILHNLIRKGINEGVFIKGINIEIFTSLIKEIVKMINFGSLANSKYTKEELFNNTFGILIRGISSQKGLLIIEEEVEKRNNNA